jgi:hypothetical protein
MEKDQPGQVGISLEQWRKAWIDPPINLALWKMAFEQTKHWQGLDDIA